MVVCLGGAWQHLTPSPQPQPQGGVGRKLNDATNRSGQYFSESENLHLGRFKKERVQGKNTSISSKISLKIS